MVGRGWGVDGAGIASWVASWVGCDTHKLWSPILCVFGQGLHVYGCGECTWRTSGSERCVLPGETLSLDGEERRLPKEVMPEWAVTTLRNHAGHVGEGGQIDTMYFLQL